MNTYDHEGRAESVVDAHERQEIAEILEHAPAPSGDVW